MVSGDYKNVLDNNSPLSEGVLNTMINKDSLMISSEYKDVLVNNSPLPTSILDQVIAGNPPIDSGDQQAVLDMQGVTICHKPGTPAQQTKVVNQSDLSGHLGHGDFIGSCGGD
jgi:hypothetical protein